MEELRPLVTAVVQSNPESKTSLLMKDKMSKVNTLAADTQNLYDERLKALEMALDAGDKFWTGLDEIKQILKEVQEHLDSEEPPAADLDVLEEQMQDHQVRIFFHKLAGIRDVYTPYSKMAAILVFFCFHANWPLLPRFQM